MKSKLRTGTLTALKHVITAFSKASARVPWLKEVVFDLVAFRAKLEREEQL